MASLPLAFRLASFGAGCLGWAWIGWEIARRMPTEHARWLAAALAWTILAGAGVVVGLGLLAEWRARRRAAAPPP